ncbi:MAG: P-loop NTPase, partial [Culicoidibacterales bacterium]
MNQQTIAQAIQNIIDPVTKLPLLSSKTLLDIVYADEKAELTFAFERQNTPEFAAFQKYLLKTLKIELGIKGVKIHYARPKQPPTVEPKPTVFSGPKNARYLAIASGKGGVGKSTVTVELAKALQLIFLATQVCLITWETSWQVDHTALAVFSYNNYSDGMSSPNAWISIYKELIALH